MISYKSMKKPVTHQDLLLKPWKDLLFHLGMALE